MKKDLIIAIDQSTSGTKGLLVDSTGRIIKKHALKHKQIYPQPGWVEHDPIEIYENTKCILNDLIDDVYISTERIAALSITNQRETIVVWDKETGKPIHHAIVWQCRRSTEICRTLAEQGYEKDVLAKTGLQLDPYFSASKVTWILENVEGAKQKAREGKLLLGTMDSWLIWNLTAGKVHATDVTNASRTLLYNIYTNDWDDDLLAVFGIPREMLPEVKQSDARFGEISDADVPLLNVAIAGVIGDSQGALFAQKCVEKGMAKATFGTGTSIMVYTKEPIKGKHGLVTSLAWGMDGEVHYALEGIINTSGDTIRWLKNELQLFTEFAEIEAAANSIVDNCGVYLIPAFVGLGAPYWSPDSRAAIFGMDRSTTKNHLIRAGLESIAYQVKDIIELVCSETDITIKELRVDGGATENKFLMQFLADMLDAKVIVSDTAELSAMGAVYLSGLSSGVWGSFEEIRQLDAEYHTYHPEMSRDTAENYYREWKRYVHLLVQENIKVFIRS